MADTFRLSVLTPLAEVFSGEVGTVTVSGHQGDFGVLPGHVAYITSVDPGALVIDAPAGRRVFAIGEGFAQVAASKVSIIVSSSDEVGSLDAGAVKAALEKAERALLEFGPQDSEHRGALHDQALALGRLRALDART